MTTPSGPVRGSHRPVDAQDARVERLVDLARHAPSVHNTQPWRWRLTDAGLELHADLARRLPAEDPSGRNLIISCGAALHHLQFAAAALGWTSVVERQAPRAGETLLARIAVPQESAVAEVRAEDLALLRQRCTDRRRFTSWPVSPDSLRALEQIADRWGARSMSVDDVAARFRLEIIANRAITAGDLDQERRKDQESWLDRSPYEGIPSALLAQDPDPLSARTRFRPQILEDVRLAVGHGDGVIVLGGDTDDTGGWLRTGEALSAVWLEATRIGLSLVPLSQPTQVDATRDQIAHEVLDDAFVPHLLIRIGWQAVGRSELPRTPRRPLAPLRRH